MKCSPKLSSQERKSQWARISWWHHQMETFSALLAICAGNSPVSGEFPAQRPVTRSFDVFFDLHLIKRLSKHSRGWWFETLSRPLWRHCNVLWIPNTHHWPYSGAQPLALHVSIVSNAPVLARSLSSHSGFYIKCTILALRRMEVSWHLQEIYRANNFYVDYLIVVKLYTNSRFMFSI